MLKIGDFSKLSRISIRMLRHYNEIGLLIPAETDPFTNYRHYSEAQLTAANRISSLKEMGFSLATIGEILKSYQDPEALAQFLLIQQSETLKQSEETNRRLRLIDATIERLRKDSTTMKYNVTLKEIPERYVVSTRMVIPAYDQESILWNTLCQETQGMNLQMADPCYSLAVFHDKGFKDQDVDVEIQMAVKGSYQDTGHVQFKTVPSVQVASATYQGSYEQLTAVNEVVANWVNDNGYEFNGAMFCIYHVSYAQTQNPDELVTEVCYPVQKK